MLETVSHLNVKDITSGDSEVLVPSSNAEIAGRSNIPCNVSDTTFDESVKTVESLQMSLDEQTSAQCTSDSMELKDRVVQSGSVNGINEKENCESDQNRNDSKEMSQVTGEMMLPINPDVTENQSTMEVSTHSMGTDKSSYKESDCGTSESRETNISLQYLTDEGINNLIYTKYISMIRVTESPYFLDIKFGAY